MTLFTDNKLQKIIAILLSGEIPRDPITKAAAVLGNTCQHQHFQNITKVIVAACGMPPSTKLAIHCLTLASNLLSLGTQTNTAIGWTMVSGAVSLISQEIIKNPATVAKKVFEKTSETLSEL